MGTIAFYKKWVITDHNDSYVVVDRQERKILFTGTEEECSKYFIMLVAGFINENGTMNV